jgi:hypothetical protein
MRLAFLTSSSALLLALALAPAARAEEPTAAQILEKARRTGALGLVGARATVKLTVDDGRGGRRERALTAVAADTGGEVRRLVRFLEPAEVRGVGFLVVEKPGKAAERLLWLPSQKRVRRVSGAAGGGSFLGTDFAYADLDLAGGRDDVQTREKDAEVNGQKCWVVATKPSAGDYGRIVTYVHQETGVPLRVSFEGADGKPVKRLEVARVKQLGGRWIALESVMETLATGSKTTIVVESLDAAVAISADELSERALERF